tara:strand:+ start:1488 stop:1748 length:261 start_codon:yes stop_codon:yes gene_type:complete
VQVLTSVWNIGENIMKEQLIKAARMHAEGELERAKTNIMVYMNQSVGIGEHSDIVEAIQEELDKMAAATDRIEMLEQHFEDDDYLK